MERIKSCPFCGVIPNLSYDKDGDCYWICCYNPKCKIGSVFTDDYKRKSIAIKQWNSRKE